MNEDQLRASGFVKTQDGSWSKPPRNRQPLAGLQNPQPEHREVQALARCAPKQAGRKKSVVECVVEIISYRKTELDDDNCIGGSKGLRDAIAQSLGIDDGDPRIKFRVSQQIGTAAGTHVLITRL